ncbi:AraC family transcriptional regulator [Aphanothece hegewaldii CCALA 016]|uniref:AraC family transcriptional regulator n=1 Tax=Aphanothece hegewaldii CCALA 016 TaxID=2107694 RepID=A0A2T1LRH0_9CHRO|nr:AraC family transcriptional regulator [Aphanothece hegewaldii]PSF30990.1 AraC family transcriptional regulator [Aphanothece hegewaldii CCALA 016]
MSAIPLVRANAILPLVRFLDRSGVPTEKFLRQVKLPIYALENSESLVSLYQVFNFAEKVAYTEGIEHLGILASQQVEVKDFGIFGRIASQSLTLYDLLNTISQLLTKTHNSGARAWVTQRGDQIWFNHQYINPYQLDNQQAQYYACLMYLKIIHSFTDGRWYPTDLHFQTSPLHGLGNLEVFSNVRLHFNQANNAIAFPKTQLYLPLPRTRSPFFPQQQQEYELLLSSAPPVELRTTLELFIRSGLLDGHSDIKAAASAAGMSLRSFQRRLAGEGLSYSKLVEQTRFNLAVTWLKDPTMRLIDIAVELGYTDATKFTRAFKRWTGVAPSEFRRQQLTNHLDLPLVMHERDCFQENLA